MAIKYGAFARQTSTTTGTGTLTLSTKPDNKSVNISAVLSTGDESTFLCIMGDVWEWFDGTLTSGTTLTRDTVHLNSSGGTSKVSWASGTKLVYIVPPPDPLRYNKVNTWTATQRFNGQELFLDADNDTSIRSPSDDVVTVKINGVDTCQISAEALRIISTDGGAGSGPSLNLDRASGSQAASDLLAALNWRGRTSTGVDAVYARALASVVSPTNASYAGKLDLAVAAAASLSTQLSLEAGKVYTGGSTDFHAGKSASDQSTTGCSLHADGTAHVTKASADAIIWRLNGLTGSQRVLSIRRGGTTVMDATSTATSGGWNVASDQRLKDEIGPAGDVGAIVDALRPVWYSWKDDPARVELGLFAQEAAQHLPHVVSGSPDGDPHDAPMMLDYGKLTPLLLAEIQSLRRRIAALESRAG